MRTKRKREWRSGFGDWREIPSIQSEQIRGTVFTAEHSYHDHHIVFMLASRFGNSIQLTRIMILLVPRCDCFFLSHIELDDVVIPKVLTSPSKSPSVLVILAMKVRMDCAQIKAWSD